MAKGPFGSQQFSARDGEADMSTNGKRHEANRVDPLIPTNPLPSAITISLCTAQYREKMWLMRAHLHNRQRLQQCHSVAFRVSNGHI